MATNKQDKVLNIPPLRFPGFTDEWKKCIISDYGDIVTGTTPATNQEENYSNGEYLWATPSDLGSEKYIYTTQTKLSKKGFDKTRSLPPKAILVTCIGSTIGKMGMAKNKMSTNQQINSIVVNSAFDADFVYYAIQSKFPRYMSSIAIQAVPILSKSEFGKLSNVKTAIEEQIKIGNFLSKIDERITTQNKIIEDLKKLKSAIIDKVFLTLKGVSLSLGEVANISKGKQVNGELLTETGDYYVMNGGVEPSGYYHAFNISANTISISEGGNSCGYIQWNSVPFWSGGHCYTLNIKDASVENKYLYHFLKWSEPEIMKLRIGSGLPNIQKKDLERVSIIIPTNSTQKEITDLADSIDGKIDTECSILLLLHHQKTYLLSKLFI